MTDTEGRGSRVLWEGRREGFVAREVRGWRAASIDRCLDLCAWVPNYGHIDWAVDRPKARTREYYRAYARLNAEVVQANNRVQAAKWRERARAEWDVYCVRYAERFPESKPVGFDRWSRTGLAKWRIDPELCMVPNVRFDRIEHQRFRDAVFKRKEDAPVLIASVAEEE